MAGTSPSRRGRKGTKGEKWTTREDQYLAEIAPGRPVSEIAVLLNEKFGRRRTTTAIKCRLSKLGVKTDYRLWRDKPPKRPTPKRRIADVEALVIRVADEMEMDGLPGLAIDLEMGVAAALDTATEVCDVELLGVTVEGETMIYALNSITLSGNLTRDPRYFEEDPAAGRSSMLSFSIAQTSSTGRGDDLVKRAHYFPVRVYGPYADYLKDKIAKGTYVAVQGRLRMIPGRPAEDGQPATANGYIVSAERVDFRPPARTADPEATEEQHVAPAPEGPAEDYEGFGMEDLVFVEAPDQTWQ